MPPAPDGRRYSSDPPAAASIWRPRLLSEWTATTAVRGKAEEAAGAARLALGGPPATANAGAGAPPGRRPPLPIRRQR
ncbi:hypothetical protein GQ55_1G165600 [Panicum hallii var. hallii]|uniref:Uncharacterized protein n=1 Tax=Panicum hallii var. hallii TaxID=1504633 RepID=A0A2T7F5Q5_9POAL|nr:hypothetical protein GQ55_1G165600 [Panicum hallii var. hallii]